MKTLKRLFILTPIVVLVVIGLLTILVLVADGTAAYVFHGPKIVQSVESPDKAWTAYVEDQPELDGPHHGLFVESADKVHFLGVGDLVADVDAIQEIVWSPDSRMVIFHSRDYLTAVRVSDWKTVRIYLGRDWMRAKPDRRSTFSASAGREVTAIRFPAKDEFAYKLKDSDELHTASMN
ncbi:MAG TPA: hypothetical protein VFI02_02890 [Armatimonadota bacterium]|nr:hypothetical protein [Armatimonadota bacterium]